MKFYPHHFLFLMGMVALPTTCAVHGEEGQATSKAAKVVVSGFGPFAGRAINGSSVLARSIADRRKDFKAIEIPVLWGAPKDALQKHSDYDFWLAFGEGTKVFRIEVRADNRRGNYPDAAGHYPSQNAIEKNGPEHLLSPIPAAEIAKSLTSQGFPTVVSMDAGDYLCEEMLFTLMAQNEAASDCMFVHIPVLGQSVKLSDGTSQIVSIEWLAAFGSALVKELSDRKLIPPEKGP